MADSSCGGLPKSPLREASEEQASEVVYAAIAELGCSSCRAAVGLKGLKVRV